MDARRFRASNQLKTAPMSEIVFEDEEDFSEGLDEFTEQIKAIDSRPTTIGAELSVSQARVTISEHPRTFTAQRAATSNRSPSPMDIDSGIETMQAQEHTISPSPPSTATRASSHTSAAQSVAVPSKRPTDIYDFPSPSSLPPSPSTLPQPAKRLHATSSARRVSPQASSGAEFGSELDPFIIAHDASAQALLDAHGLAWGTIYELARGVSKDAWQWSEVTRDKIAQLRGPNAHAAHRVIAVMQGREVPRGPAAELWIEYDREQDAILENKGRGLGGMGPWRGKDGWYGGRIQQVGRLVRREHGRGWGGLGPYAIQLEKPEIRRSHRFSRFLGSRRILQVRVADNLLYGHGDEVRMLLSSSKFILCGRVYLPFHAKEGSMYLMETSQDYERSARHEDGDQFRISLNDFVNWHNPLGSNSKQPISKWSTRWALGLSTSIPTIKIDPQYFFEIPDINVSPQDWEGKTPAEKVLTDGCGYINGAALTQIMRMMGYGLRPTAVQGRIGGSKGMWVLHPDPEEQVPDGPAKIWIRPSQTKIKLPPFVELGPAQRIFDLLAPSRVIGPSNLSSQTLINLSHNGIDHQVLKELMALGLREEIQPFIDWTQPHSMILVWKAIERAGSVVVSRLRRSFIGQARALGLGQLRPKDNEMSSQEYDEEGDEGRLLEEGEEKGLQHFIDNAHKKFSGQPYTLHETALELLQAGFHPMKLELLFQKLEVIITQVLDDYMKKFHIPVKESCEAYIIPDPYGVLKEGEIHFRTSEPFVNPTTGEIIDMILGDVLVSRNPTRLPSDIQKVKAVAHPKLRNYFNVIIFSIKGRQSLASFLGGGDYDGDTVMLNWCRPLVEQFRGSSLCTAPSNISSFFEREVEHVKDFDRRASKLAGKAAQQEFQRVLLLGLAETKVGLYSKYHDAAVYVVGYDTQAAIHLAYMFTTCLDASKTGLRVKKDVFLQDGQQWGSKLPWYKSKTEEGKEGNKTQKIVKRPTGLPFILDVLVEEGERLRKEALHEYRGLRVHAVEEDLDLSRPWNAAKARASQAKAHGVPGLWENLQDINNHVEEAWKLYRRAVTTYQDVPAKGSVNKEGLFDTVTSFFAHSLQFRSGFVFFSDGDIQTLKASLASTKSLRFAFAVAFHDLCAIKAQAAGSVSVTHQFAQSFSIPNIVARTLAQVGGDQTY